MLMELCKFSVIGKQPHYLLSDVMMMITDIENITTSLPVSIVLWVEQLCTLKIQLFYGSKFSVIWKTTVVHHLM